MVRGQRGVKACALAVGGFTVYAIKLYITTKTARYRFFSTQPEGPSHPTPAQGSRHRLAFFWCCDAAANANSGALFRGWSVYMPVGSSGTESGMKWPDTIDATPIIARRLQTGARGLSPGWAHPVVRPTRPLGSVPPHRNPHHPITAGPRIATPHAAATAPPHRRPADPPSSCWRARAVRAQLAGRPWRQ